MSNNLHHPSGMPYHIYHNVMGNKALSDVTQRNAHMPGVISNSSAAVLLPTRPLALNNQMSGRSLAEVQMNSMPLKSAVLSNTPPTFLTMSSVPNVVWQGATLHATESPRIDRAVAAAVSLANSTAFSSLVAGAVSQHHHLQVGSSQQMQLQPQPSPSPSTATNNSTGAKKKAPRKRYPPTKIHSCSFCPYTCNRPDKLRVHIMGVHNNDKPYPCEYCEKSFKQRDKLTRHVNTVHFKNKPFSCEYCQQMFGRKDKAKRHVAVVHFGEKPFRCNYCSHKTSRRDKMRAHLAQVHSKDGSEFYKLSSEEARDVRPPVPLPQHPVPLDQIHSVLQQSLSPMPTSP